MANEPSMTHAVDQMDKAMQDMATMIGKFYKTLIESEIPQETAERMVLDMSAKWCSNIFEPGIDLSGLLRGMGGE